MPKCPAIICASSAGACDGEPQRRLAVPEKLLQRGCASRPQVAAQASVWQPAWPARTFSQSAEPRRPKEPPEDHCPSSPGPGVASALSSSNSSQHPGGARGPQLGPSLPGGRLASENGPQGRAESGAQASCQPVGGQRGLWAGHVPSRLTGASLQVPHRTARDPAARRLPHRVLLSALSCLPPWTLVPVLLARCQGKMGGPPGGRQGVRFTRSWFRRSLSAFPGLGPVSPHWWWGSGEQGGASGLCRVPHPEDSPEGGLQAACPNRLESFPPPLGAPFL